MYHLSVYIQPSENKRIMMLEQKLEIRNYLVDFKFKKELIIQHFDDFFYINAVRIINKV